MEIHLVHAKVSCLVILMGLNLEKNLVKHLVRKMANYLVKHLDCRLVITIEI